MSDVEMSSTCPDVRVNGGNVMISDDFNSSTRDVVVVNAYDLDAFIDEMVAARLRVRLDGYKTGWSRDADGKGNCGPVKSGVGGDEGESKP